MIESNQNKNKLKKFLKLLGPGFITGASDDDPSGIATYAQTGARFGYSQVWTALFTTPFMIAIQEMCGRIGMVTGRGLAGVIKLHFAKTILYGAVFLLVLANIINIGADLGAMASVTKLAFKMPFILCLVGFVLLTLALEIFVSYKKYARYLKYLTFFLLAYIITAFLIKQDWLTIFQHTIVPSISWNKIYLLNIVAILGTTISPYLFFWQADEEVEEEIVHRKLKMMGQGIPRIHNQDIHRMRIDTVIGMIFSNIIMFFIIITSAATLGANGFFDIQTADQAAQALQPLAGSMAFYIFSLGIIGTGLLAIPILAGSASYAVSESFGWPASLGKKLKKAKAFYLVIALATVIGLFINFLPFSPFQILYYAAVVNGLLAPPLLVLILLIANNKKIMGDYVNRSWSNWLGWSITGIMTVSVLALIMIN
ncbi:MAG: divalent metal cation transporter [Patescibacteria group bacterium]